MKPEYVTELVKYRLEQAHAALSDARLVLDGGGSPMSIVNRAYYAMFYSVLALLQTIGKAPSKHQGVVGLFDTEFVLSGIFPKELSRDFHRAFDARQVWDYKPVQPATPDEATELLSTAQHFVAEVEGYLIRKSSDSGP
jgi:uncharacterized protein (UPF0332 family)